MQISVVIPTYNEAQNIAPCLQLFAGQGVELILADSPDSNDSLEKMSEAFGFTYLKTKKAGRNHQMNEGAAAASGNILYFVHADTLVHPNFKTDIISAIQNGADMGCYRYKFDRYPNPLMYINSYFTRFPMIWCRGGDQTLFIKKEVFEELNGFCPEHLIMEDYDILLRSKDRYQFKIIQKDVTVSARKYETNSYFRILKANYIVMRKWLKKEASPAELHQLYKNLLNYRNG